MNTDRWTKDLIQAGTDYLLTAYLQAGQDCDPRLLRSHVSGTLAWLLTSCERDGFLDDMLDLLHMIAQPDEPGVHVCALPEEGQLGDEWECSHCGAGWVGGMLWTRISGPRDDWWTQHGFPGLNGNPNRGSL